MILTGQQVTFDDVAARTGLALYRNSDLRRIIEEHRAHGKEAHTQSGLTTEIAHLRIALDAHATNVAATKKNSAASQLAETIRQPQPVRRPPSSSGAPARGRRYSW